MIVLPEQYLEVHGNTYNFASADNKPRQNKDNYLKRNDYSQGKCAYDQLNSSPKSTDLIKPLSAPPARETRTCFLCNKKPSSYPGSNLAMHARQVEKRTSARAIMRSMKRENGNSQVERGVEIGVLSPELSTDMPVVIGRIC